MCSSGSGTPKANGTQECECKSSTQGKLTAEVISNDGFLGYVVGYINYDNLKIGEMNATSYRNGTITGFLSNYSLNKTILSISPYISDTSDINIRINGAIFKFKFIRNENGISQFTCDKFMFNQESEYTIEFLN